MKKELPIHSLVLPVAIVVVCFVGRLGVQASPGIFLQILHTPGAHPDTLHTLKSGADDNTSFSFQTFNAFFGKLTEYRSYLKNFTI